MEDVCQKIIVRQRIIFVNVRRHVTTTDLTKVKKSGSIPRIQKDLGETRWLIQPTTKTANRTTVRNHREPLTALRFFYLN